MLLRILCLWDIPPEDLGIFYAPLRDTLGSAAGVEFFFAHRHTDDWEKTYTANSINAFIFLSAQNISTEYLPEDFFGPACILDLSAFYTYVDPLEKPIQHIHDAEIRTWTSSPQGYDIGIGEGKELHHIYKFTPPFSLRALLSTLRKSLLSFSRSSALHYGSSQMGNSIFDRPHKRCIRHPDVGDIFLTEKEVAILDLLMENAPQRLTKKAILEAVWGYLPDTPLNTHTLETHIYRLRQKFEEHGLASIILSDHEGYAFNGEQSQG